MSSFDSSPSRKYPNVPMVTEDTGTHMRALTAVVESLSIHERRTADVLSSFVRVQDLIDLRRLKLTAKGSLSPDDMVRAPSYAVGELPAAAAEGAGAVVFVSNEAGGAVLAFSDGSDWRRVTDRAVVS